MAGKVCPTHGHDGRQSGGAVIGRGGRSLLDGPNVSGSGGVQQTGRTRHEQPLGHCVQQLSDGTGCWQMQHDAVLELPDLHSNLEQFRDDRRGLGVSQNGMSQRLGAQLLMQNIGCRMLQQAHVIGQERRA